MCILNGETPPPPFLRILREDALHHNEELNQQRGGMGFRKQKRGVGDSQDDVEGKPQGNSCTLDLESNQSRLEGEDGGLQENNHLLVGFTIWKVELNCY